MLYFYSTTPLFLRVEEELFSLSHSTSTQTHNGGSVSPPLLGSESGFQLTTSMTWLFLFIHKIISFEVNVSV